VRALYNDEVTVGKDLRDLFVICPLVAPDCPEVGALRAIEVIERAG
jgi:hypothetical protein